MTLRRARGRRPVWATTFASLALVIAGGIGACGDDGSTRDDAIDAVVAAMTADATLADYDPAPEELACVGESLVESLGAEKVLLLYRAGDEDPALSAAETEALASAFDLCLADVRQIAVDFLATSLSADPTEDAPVTPAQARCVADRVADAVPLAALFDLGEATAPTTGGAIGALEAETAAAFAAAYVACVDARAAILSQIGAEGATADQVACFDDEIPDDALVAYYQAAFAGTPLPDLYADAADACF